MIPRGFMRSERALSVSNVTIKQNTQRSKVVSNVKIKQIIFLHFISGGKSRRKLKKKIPYRLPQNWLGGRLFYYTAF